MPSKKFTAAAAKVKTAKVIPEALLKTKEPKSTKAAPAVKLSLSAKKKIEKQYQNEIKEVLGLPVKDDSAEKVQEKSAPKLSAIPAPPVVATAKTAAAKNSPVKAVEPENLSEAELAKIRAAVLAEIKSPVLPVIEEKVEPLPVAAEPVKKQPAGETEQAVAIIIGPKGVKHHLLRIVRIIFLTAVFLLFLSAAGIYLGGWDQSAVKKVAEFIPYPVLKVNNRLIAAKIYFADLSALKKYLNRAQITAGEADIKSQVIKSLIAKEVIAQLAARQGLSVTAPELQQQLDLIVASAASKAEIEKLVKDLYDWDLSEYGEKIIKPLLLAKKVEGQFNQSPANSAIKKQMADYLAELNQDPTKFEAIAGAVNQDSTKYVAGDLGWFALGTLAPELEAALLNLQPGQFSAVVESADGYHIIKLIEKLSDDKTGQTTFHAAQIFLQRPSFADYLNEQIKKAKVLTFIKI
ncbi:MAG: peptidylprolyl isomerase [Candidatus Komeilibacteria bacterium]|nr:peptidylprolyl isomerase [Candidatus Komeilibacteria bacterium]